MKCIILAAGYATRLYPLTENFPKPLLKVGRKTILDWLIDDIETSGKIDEYIVISNHKFFEFFEDWANKKNLNIKVIDDGTITNEGRLGAVRDIQLGVSCDDSYMVIAGDNLLDFSITGFIDFFGNKKSSCVMTHVENDLRKRQKTAIITFDEAGLIDSYEEKPISPKGNHAVPPFYIYTSEDIACIDEALSEGCGYDAPGSFAAWLSKKTKVYAYQMPGKRYDIGDMESYRSTCKVFEEA